MQTFELKNEVEILMKEVTIFPLGITKAFDDLVKEHGCVAPGLSYFGLSKLAADGSIVYYAAVERKEKKQGDAGMISYTIPAGTYIVEALKNWRDKTDQIKEACCKVIAHPGVAGSGYCIEWYKSDEEMWCMVKLREKVNTSHK